MVMSETYECNKCGITKEELAEIDIEILCVDSGFPLKYCQEEDDSDCEHAEVICPACKDGV